MSLGEIFDTCRISVTRVSAPKSLKVIENTFSSVVLYFIEYSAHTSIVGNFILHFFLNTFLQIKLVNATF
jgi:hypothetical protein